MALSNKKIIVFIVVFLVLLLVIIPLVAYFLANSNAKSNVAKFTETFKEICDIEYGKVSYNIINRHLVVKNIAIMCNNEKIIDIEKAEFNHIVKNVPIPTNLQVDITNGILYNKSDIFQKYGKAAADIGYDKINFQGRITYTLGKASKEFNLVTLNIVAIDFGNISGEAKVPNTYNKNIKNIIINILNNPASFYITFTDKGLKNKVFQKFAAISDFEIEEIKTKTTNAIYKRSLNADNFTKSNYTQLEKFLLNSDSISLQQNLDDNISISTTLHTLDLTGYRKLLSSFKDLKIELIAK